MRNGLELKKYYKYIAEVLEAIPGTRDEGGPQIHDAIIKVKAGDISFWCFFHDLGWVSDKWCTSVIGTKLSFEFPFLNLASKLAETKEKRIIPIDQRNLDRCKIVGEIVDKGNVMISGTNEYEDIFVDCGVIVRAGDIKDKFKIGDYIEAEGRLHAYKIKGVREDEEKIRTK